MALRRPDGLGDAEWTAIKEAEGRLRAARNAGDAPLVVGSAKELCEAIAKVVIAERGGVPPGKMPALVAVAHRLLEFQPGEGVANDPETRKVARGLVTVVVGLVGMRNRHGTGHGRAAPTGVAKEHAGLASDAALLWSSWALRRLEPYIAGDPTRLVRELEGQVFTRGKLARWLTFANLPRLPVDEQRRVGMAVARRAAAGTFVVAEDGVDAVHPGDEGTWPAGYVEGLVTGFFFDPNGQLDLDARKVRESARLISGLRKPLPVLQQLADWAATAESSYRLASDEDTLRETLDEFKKTARTLPQGEVRDLWRAIGRSLTS